MGFLTVSISCRLSLRWEDIFQAEQNLSKLHVNSSNQTSATAEQQCIVLMYFGLFCVFFLTFCLSEAGTEQFLCQAPLLLSPAPVRQEGLRDYSRCRWLCSKVHISCKKAQLGMLKTSWKTRSYTRLLHQSLCCKKKSDGVQQCELLILWVFPNQRRYKVLCQGPHAR